MCPDVLKRQRIGLVLSGGGARGAYEAGVMSVLSPALDARGERPTIYIGTSVGAVNAAYLAAAAHLPAEAEASGSIARWREVQKSTIIRPILLRQAPLTAIRYLGEILSLPGVRLPSLLDPKPFERNLDNWIDWDSVHGNVAAGEVQVVGTVATAARTGRTVVFVEGHHERVTHRSHAIDYVPTELDDQHVRASAAIPILFPPVRVEHPRDARGWYFDGGTRLNTPIKPALDLGSEKLVVVATDPVAEPRAGPAGTTWRPPDFGDGALHVLEDAGRPGGRGHAHLGNINMFFRPEESQERRGEEDAARPTPRPSATAPRGKKPTAASPTSLSRRKRGAIGGSASEVFRTATAAEGTAIRSTSRCSTACWAGRA
jgi:NTE family protein